MRTSTLALFLTASALAQPPGITTKAYDNARSGMWPHETVLTQDAVTRHGLVLERTIPVYGDARGMEAQPLIAPHVLTKAAVLGSPPCEGVSCIAVAIVVKGAEYHDVMVLPSMANVVRGVDAETGAALWQTTLGMPIQGSAKIDFHSINDKWGCLSTGVIVGAKWYGVCQVSIDNSGTSASGRYFMFALSLADGTQTMKPVNVQGSDNSLWKQRSALAYDAKTNAIFFAHGSVYETANGYTGGITAFDVATNTVAAQLPMSSGIWMGGQGVVIGPDGYLYAITGNGAFDPSKGWYGEAFVKVRYADKKLAIVDQWSPWSDTQRTGQSVPKYAQAAPKMAGESSPSEAVKPVGGGMSMPLADARVEAAMTAQGQVVSRVYPTMAQGAWSDEDWGSAGPACIFAVQTCIAAGKDGIGYPIRTGGLGGTTAANVGTAANYGKLAAPCAWLTMSPGNVPCDPADSRTLNFLPNGVTAHLHMTPVSMYDPMLKSWVIFVWGENAQLHKWKVGQDGKLTYVAQSAEFASADNQRLSPGGMPGGFCSASSSGLGGMGDDASSMLLFCSVPYGDANATITQGRFIVYDPIHPAADGSLKVLWDSQRWGVAYTFNKFMAPTVWNGRVYLPNYNGGVMVFGLGK